jgi:hypothetical protein
MKPLTPEELTDLRNDLAALDISPERLDDLIRLVDAVVISFVDQAFGRSAEQLSLAARANYAFNGQAPCDSFLVSEQDKTVDLVEEGAINKVSPERQPAP